MSDERKHEKKCMDALKIEDLNEAASEQFNCCGDHAVRLVRLFCEQFPAQVACRAVSALVETLSQMVLELPDYLSGEKEYSDWDDEMGRRMKERLEQVKLEVLPPQSESVH